MKCRNSYAIVKELCPRPLGTFFVHDVLALNNDILENPLYLKPKDAPHFLWRDIYKAVCAGKHVLSIWLRCAFEELGFTPPVEKIGKL